MNEAILTRVLFLPIRISPVQLSDSGVYTCVARSRAGLAELSYDVQVQGTIRAHSASALNPTAVFRFSGSVFFFVQQPKMSGSCHDICVMFCSQITCRMVVFDENIM